MCTLTTVLLDSGLSLASCIVYTFKGLIKMRWIIETCPLGMIQTLGPFWHPNPLESNGKQTSYFNSIRKKNTVFYCVFLWFLLHINKLLRFSCLYVVACKGIKNVAKERKIICPSRALHPRKRLKAVAFTSTTAHQWKAADLLLSLAFPFSPNGTKVRL